MATSLTLSGAAALFGVMVAGALIPGVSVLAVSSRSAASGFIHGATTTMGIAIGDIVFILIAVFGLSILAEQMGDLFDLVKYLCGAYLVWLGVTLLRARSSEVKTEGVADSSLLSSFLAGLLITLGDQKAILFYLGLLPAFLDVSALSYIDTAVIIAIAMTALSTKLIYAFMASRAGYLLNANLFQGLNIVAGGVLISVGIYVIFRT